MQFHRVFAALTLLFALASSALSQTDTQLFPIADLKPGMKGVGRTVFSGDRIEDFQVEILGVLSNALAPKRDLILARLSGGPLEKTGVIAGMSGSPVYIDGKLVGAVARSFPFSKEPLAGITPIEGMLQVVPEAKGQTQLQSQLPLDFRMARTATGPRDSARLIPEEDLGPEWFSRFLPAREATATVTDLQLPLRFGGFSAVAMQPYLPLFRQLGFEPMMGGGLSGGESSSPVNRDLEPGSMISLMLVRGDLNLNADCTVTFRQGNNLYACGHQLLSAGPVEFPFAPARVLVTVPSIASSFKLDAPGQVAGTIRQDRFDAVYGVVGQTNPPMIPVTIQIQTSLNTRMDYKFDVVEEPLLSPLLVNLAVTSILGNTERAIGASTLEISGRIRLAGGETVDVQDVLSGDTGASAMAGSVVATPLAYLMASGFQDLDIKGVDLLVKSRNERSVATIEKVWSTKSEVRPGDHIEVIALFRLPGGQSATRKISVDIPESVSDKALTLVVGGGANINALQFRMALPGSSAHDIHQLVKALNRMRRNNRLYALLMAPERSFTMQGDEYPSPPPSLVQTLLADPGAASSFNVNATSVVGDYETAAFPLAIQGQKTLLLKVIGPGL